MSLQSFRKHLPVLHRGFQEPLKIGRVALAILRGHLTIASCRIRGVRLTAGPGLRVYGRLVVRGPGLVILGTSVVIDRTVTPWTYSSDAVIKIGDGCYLNGTRFGCKASISVGADSILSDASITDTDFHSTHINRRSLAAPIRTLPVSIGENVWIAAAAGILPGSVIGRNSVVGFGAVCTGTYPADVILAGNPARVVNMVPGTRPEELPIDPIERAS
jgi:acetyltransferase-like isoleucine patch superfamily enzyme